MTITSISYNLEFLRNLDLAQGPADSVDDVIALAGGGFAALGFDSGHLDLDIVKADYTDGGGANDIPGQATSGDLVQLSDGNILVVYTPDHALPLAEIRSPTGAVVKAAFEFGQSYHAKVAALTGGGFVIVRDGFPPGGNGAVFDSSWALYNNAGTFLIENSFGTTYEHQVAALDDGGFAIASRGGTGGIQLWIAIYNANGSERLAPTMIDPNVVRGPLSITATDEGFALLVPVGGFSANDDIGLFRFNPAGDGLAFGTLSGGATIDQTPDIARLPGGLLAVSWTMSNVSVNDSETFAGIFNPATNAYEDYRTVTGGEPLTDDTDAPQIAAHGGRLAVFHNNVTDGDVDGEDLLVVRSVQIDGGDSFDGDDLADRVYGGQPANYLRGYGNDDRLFGDGGDDSLEGGTGNDSLDGGAGDDTASYIGATGGVTVSLAIAGPQAIGGGQGSDTLVSIERLVGSAYADRLTGNAANNTFDGYQGADTMSGGLGDDTYYFAEQADIIVEAANAGTDTITTRASTFSLYNIANVENLSYTPTGPASNTHDFVGRGNALNNIITGNLLNDRFIVDQGGADQFFGGQGTDTMDFRSSLTGAVVDVSTGIHGGAAAGDTYDSIEVFYGSDTAADMLTGNVLAQRFEGFGGNDTLAGGNSPSGGVGSDTLLGGLGNDTYIIDGGAENVIELANQGTDTIVSSYSYSLVMIDNVERLFLSGTRAIDGTGNSLANLLLGNDKINTLNGRDGDDTLNGGGGADTINGGSGLDRLIGGLQRDKIVPGTDNVRDDIVFTLIGESTGQTRDVIMGLDLNNEDRIDLPGTVSSIAAARSGALSIGTFNQNLASVFNAAALPANAAALFTPTSGDLVNPNMVYLIVDANGVAGYQANADWVFQLENHTGALDTSDFV